MNHAVLRNLAAATAIICQHRGGNVGMFFLLKAIYLADRESLIDYGYPITGDKYSSMVKGPMLSGLYNLLRRDPGLRDSKAQAEWDSAISMKDFMVSIKSGATVDTDCLAPVEVKLLKEKIDLIIKLDAEGVRIGEWMHKVCPEWEQVEEGHSKSLSLKRILIYARNLDNATAAKLEENVKEGLAVRSASAFSATPILR